MLDKVIYVNQNEMYLIFTNREPVRLYSDQNVLDLYFTTFISPRPQEVTSFEQYCSTLEDTQPLINIDELEAA